MWSSRRAATSCTTWSSGRTRQRGSLLPPATSSSSRGTPTPLTAPTGPGAWLAGGGSIGCPCPCSPPSPVRTGGTWRSGASTATSWAAPLCTRRREDAEAAAGFAVDVVDVHHPLHFAGGSAADEADPGAVTVSVVSSGDEHRLVAAAPDGELVAYSDPYTSVAAYSTLAFVEALSHMVGDPRGRRAMRVGVDTACDCPALRKGPCRHHRLPTQRLPLRSREASARNPQPGGADRSRQRAKPVIPPL